MYEKLLSELTDTEMVLLDNSANALFKASCKDLKKEALDALKDEWEDAAKNEEANIQSFLNKEASESVEEKKILWHNLAKNAAVRKHFHVQLINNINGQSNNSM